MSKQATNPLDVFVPLNGMIDENVNKGFATHKIGCNVIDETLYSGILKLLPLLLLRSVPDLALQH